MSQEKINSLIDNITKGDNLSAEADFKSVMSDKVGDSLENERKNISKDMVTQHISDTEANDEEV